MKKNLLVLMTAAGLTTFVACNNDAETATTEDTTASTANTGTTTDTSSQTLASTSTYIDLNTNQPLDITWDSVQKRAVDKSTKAPVELYINTATHDTIYGTGYIVNNYIIKSDEGKWMLDNARIKRDGDEIKIKAGNKKFKMEEGEWKVKDGDLKAKKDDDADTVKIKQ